MKLSYHFLFLSTVLLFSIVFSACPGYGYKYHSASIPDSPVNLEEINSEYDDYNASSPVFRDEFPLVFSSNRLSKGGQMDFVFKLMALEFSKETGELSFYNETSNNLDVTIRHYPIQYLINQVNSEGNEFGPYIKSFYYQIPTDEVEYEDAGKFLMLYATDKDNDLDMWFVHNRHDAPVNLPITSLNTTYNEAYPCFNTDFSRLFFCQDKTGDYDIYYTDWDNTISVVESLPASDPKDVFPEDILNSAYDDKCPIIDGDYLVFTSNRPGGFGGYDLYYSHNVNDTWQQPVNFGDKINTQYDEYRPFLRLQNQFENHLLLFSSNRPGGKGGFDLYYTGINLD